MSCWEILIIKTSTGSAREAKRASLLGLLPDFFRKQLKLLFGASVWLLKSFWQCDDDARCTVESLWNGHRRDRIKHVAHFKKMTSKGVGNNSGRPSLKAFCCRKGILRHHFVRLTISVFSRGRSQGIIATNRTWSAGLTSSYVTLLFAKDI